MKISELQRELPYKFKWKDNVYKLDGERYYRVSDHWEPTFYLFQLEEEVEVIEEKEIEMLFLPSFEEFRNMTPAQRYKVTAIEYDKLNEIIDVINDMRDKE